MSALPIVVVTGATGRQGGSVVDSLVKSGKYRVRAATRDPSSASAQRLLAKYPSVELVTFDLTKKETVPPAFAGAHAVFAMTNFWQPDVMANPDLEFEQGKLMADAARDARVKQYIWSTLDNAEKLSKGALSHVYHLTSKALVEDYVRSIKEFTSAFVALGCYFDNFTQTFWKPKKDADGVWVYSTPMHANTQMGLADAEDTGPVVLALLENMDQFAGKVVEVSAPYMTLNELAETFTKVTGLPSKYVQVEADPKRMSQEIIEMCIWFEKYGIFNGRDLGWRSQIYDNFTTWEAYLKKTNFRPE